LSSGLIEAGFNPLLLNDNDKACCDILKMNHPDVNIEVYELLSHFKSSRV